MGKLRRFENLADIPLIQYKLEGRSLTMTCPKCGAEEEISFNEKGERIFDWRTS